MEISKCLSNKLSRYALEKDTLGESPATVYKVISPQDTLFLKYSRTIYEPTTYCVGRETEMIKWLNGKMNVPKIVFYEKYRGNHFMLITELKGVMLEKCGFSPSDYIKFLVRVLKKIQSVDITDCPFESDIAFRLREIKYMNENNLDDNDLDKELYKWLCENKPKEELVFSHGDLSGSNILINCNEIGYIDLGKAGKADKWFDIAFCVMEIRYLFHEEKYVNEFFTSLGVEPDWDKINYFILLDELL